MRKGHEIGKSMPLEVESLLSDPDVISWYDDQCWWYVRLIFESWKFSAKPAHLPNDPERLMTFAGISRREPNRVKAWKERAREVLKKFESTEDGAWIFHPKTLEVYVTQLSKWDAKRDAGSKGGIAKASRTVALLDSATSNSYTYKPITNSSQSLKEKKELDSEDLVGKVMAIGFRDSTRRSKSQIEHALFEEIESGADPPDILESLFRIYRWTNNGEFAPKCFEVIPRWRERQDFWERKDKQVERVNKVELESMVGRAPRTRQPDPEVEECLCYVRKKDGVKQVCPLCARNAQAMVVAK